MAFNAGSIFSKIGLGTRGYSSGVKTVVSGSGTMRKSIKSTGDTIKSFVRDLALIGGVAAATFTVAAKEFSDFEERLIDLRKVTEQPTEEVKQQILSIAGVLGDATELVEGYYQTISAGVTEPLKALDLLINSAQTSKSAHVDLGETIKGVTKLLFNMGDEFKNAAEASDLLFAIEKRGQTQFKELIPVIGTVAARAGDLKLTADELGASFAQLTKTARDTREAGTLFRAILLNLSREPTRKLKEALNELNFETGKAAVRQLGFINTLIELDKVAKKSGESLGDLFGAEAEASLAAISLSTDGFRPLLKEMEEITKRTGASAKAWENYSESTKALTLAFKNEIRALFKIAGNEFDSLTKKILTSSLVVIKTTKDWALTNNNLKKSFGELVSVLTSGEAKLIALTVIIPTIALSLQSLGIVAGFVAKRFIAMWAAMIGPAGLVVSGIGLVSIAIIGLRKDISNLISGTIEEFKFFASSLKTEVQQLFTEVKPIIINEIAEITALVTANLIKIQDLTKRFAKLLVTDPKILIDSIRNQTSFAEDIQKEYERNLETIFQITKLSINKLGKESKEGLTGLAKSVTSEVKRIAKEGTSETLAALSASLDLTDNLFLKIRDQISTDVDNLLSLLSDKFPTLKGLVDDYNNLFSSEGIDLESYFGDLSNLSKQLGSDLANLQAEFAKANLGIENEAKESVTGLEKIYSGFTDFVGFSLTRLVDDVKFALSDLVKSLLTGEKDASEAFKDFLNDIVDSFLSAVSDMISQLIILYALQQLTGLTTQGSTLNSLLNGVLKSQGFTGDTVGQTASRDILGSTSNLQPTGSIRGEIKSSREDDPLKFEQLILLTDAVTAKHLASKNVKDRLVTIIDERAANNSGLRTSINRR